MSNDEPKGIPTWLIPTWLKVVVGIAIAVAVFLISLYFWKFSDILAEKQDVWGQFGDYVGGILNPLFSLIALFALLHTIELQREELHKSTEQLKASAEALALQNEVMVRQQFETTFFQMLGLFNELVREMAWSSFHQDGAFKGKSCMAQLVMDLHCQYFEQSKNANINAQYHQFRKRYIFLLGCYFRTFDSIVKFVDNRKYLTDDDKKFYCDIVRTQLSENELILLFYNCLCLDDCEQEEFSPLVKKYNFLKYLVLIKPEHRELLSF